MKTTKCPCGSDKELEVCCAPYIKGLKSAETPEQCMRSRYTAFVLGEYDYIKKTWHPDTLPELSDDEPNTWVGLEIRNTSVDGDEGEVEFVAKLIFDNKLETLHEISDFEKVQNPPLAAKYEREFIVGHSTFKPERKFVSIKNTCASRQSLIA